MIHCDQISTQSEILCRAAKGPAGTQAGARASAVAVVVLAAEMAVMIETERTGCSDLWCPVGCSGLSSLVPNRLY